MALLAKLSKRERQVLKFLLEGKGNKQIAASLSISVRTVEFHLRNIYAKFGVGIMMSRAENPLTSSEPWLRIIGPIHSSFFSA